MLREKGRWIEHSSAFMIGRPSTFIQIITEVSVFLRAYFTTYVVKFLFIEKQWSPVGSHPTYLIYCRNFTVPQAAQHLILRPAIFFLQPANNTKRYRYIIYHISAYTMKEIMFLKIKRSVSLNHHYYLISTYTTVQDIISKAYCYSAR